jgi:hypothetical protein
MIRISLPHPRLPRNPKPRERGGFAGVERVKIVSDRCARTGRDADAVREDSRDETRGHLNGFADVSFFTVSAFT